MLRLRIFGVLIGAVLFAALFLALVGGTPVSAQEPAVIGQLALVKYVCPTDVGNTGTSIPGVCSDANDPNGSDVPVITAGGSVSFIYRVSYSCPTGVICEPLRPISVTISDTQLPSIIPTEYGPLTDSNSNGEIDPGDVWLYKVNGQTAFNLSDPAINLPGGGPVQGCANAQDGAGARPTYVNEARTQAPAISDLDPAAYCNPIIQAPSIDIIKYTNGEDANTPTGPEIQVGNPVVWTYLVTNNGDVALSEVAVTDNRGVTVTCPKTTLAVGEQMTCTANGTATEGQYANIGTVVGRSPTGQQVTDNDPSHYIGRTTPTRSTRPVQIPEPVTVVLFGTGLAALSAAVAARKRKE